MIADIFVLLIVVFFIYSGYRAGLMRSFVKIASYIISIIVSFFLYPIVSDLLMKTPIYKSMVELVGEKYVNESISNITEGSTFGILSKYVGEGISRAAGGISESVATLFINLLAFVIILILSKIIIRIVANLLGIFTKLPIIKQFNHLGGGILGGVLGIIVLYIVSAALLLFYPVEPDSPVAKEIETSVFASEIYENNIILDFIGKGKS